MFSFQTNDEDPIYARSPDVYKVDEILSDRIQNGKVSGSYYCHSVILVCYVHTFLETIFGEVVTFVGVEERCHKRFN